MVGLLNKPSTDLLKTKTEVHILDSLFTLGRNGDPAPIYFHPEVQSLLKTLTRIDLSKVYRKRKLGGRKLALPTYKFVTNEELQELVEDANERVNEVLQMPPVLKQRAPIDHVLSQDPALQGLETSTYVFTDVTYGIADRKRLIVVRQPEGTLREADWDVRERMNEIYFPRKGRKLKVSFKLVYALFDSIL